MLLASVTATKTAATLRLIRYIPRPSKEQGSSNSCIVPDFMAMRSHFAHPVLKQSHHDEIGHRRHAHPRLGCLCWHGRVWLHSGCALKSLRQTTGGCSAILNQRIGKLQAFVKEPNKKGRV
jgi:hypothetical protein